MRTVNGNNYDFGNEKICGIYKIENKLNGKLYIGQSVDVYHRWCEHIRYSQDEKRVDYQYPLHRAMRKYGFNNFNFEILEKCNVDELDNKEMKYIAEYNSFTHRPGSHGYNEMAGGNQGSRFRVRSKEERRKIAENRDYKTGSEHPGAKKVLYKGIIYGCIEEFIDNTDDNLKYHVIKTWLNGNHSMPQKYYDDGLMYKEEPHLRVRRKDNATEVHKTWIDNIVFNNASECAEYCGMKPSTLRSYVSKRRKMPKDLFDRGLRYDKWSMNDYEILVDNN